MTAPSNANTSGLEVVAWRSTWTGLSGQPVHELHQQEVEAIRSAKWMESATYEPLVTAASAQARIDAAEARADRLAKALEPFAVPHECDGHATVEDFNMEVQIFVRWSVIKAARAALQQETQP